MLSWQCCSRVVGRTQARAGLLAGSSYVWLSRSRLVSRVIKCRVRLKGLVQGRVDARELFFLVESARGGVG